VGWVDAPVMAAKMVVDIKSDVLKSGRELSGILQIDRIDRGSL